ncbi:TRAP transporter small permease [Pannonibacter carbonis]|uniref:TRAP transporter small permease n=1 Tax=Pannonibacter carbonis TaxID=2067569 RepID=UPI000D113F9B|nr:TRAP transporter small permease subunit [Pannonibacter carbonis]
MELLLAATRLLGQANAAALAVGRWLGALCVGAMVVIILVQVIYRYGLQNALPWTEEASRFLMLWMTGLMAPTAYRRGGFVGIDMVLLLLPRMAAALLSLLLLLLSGVLLWVGMRIGWAEVMGLGGRFALPSVSVPTSLDLSTWMSIPRGWMMASLAVGVTAMFIVNIELVLRAILSIFGRGRDLAPVAMASTLGAE